MNDKRNLEPVTIAAALQQFLVKSGGTTRVEAQQVILEWDAAVGDQLARSAKPLRIVNGVLTVKARNAVWRTELLMRKTELAKKINEYFKVELVKRVDVK